MIAYKSFYLQLKFYNSLYTRNGEIFHTTSIKKIRTQAAVTQVPIGSPNPINSSSKHKNSIRSDVSSMLKSLSDAPINLSRPENNSIITELQKYDASIYFSTDEKLILKYGPLLFFKENEKDYPILSENAKMILSCSVFISS